MDYHLEIVIVVLNAAVGLGQAGYPARPAGWSERGTTHKYPEPQTRFLADGPDHRRHAFLFPIPTYDFNDSPVFCHSSGLCRHTLQKLCNAMVPEPGIRKETVAVDLEGPAVNLHKRHNNQF